MDDEKTRSAIQDQAELIRILRQESRSEPPAFCGYGKDPESNELILWRYAQGLMDAEEAKAFEEHKEICGPCLERLAEICRSLEYVEGQKGFSREKVRARLAARERRREKGLRHRIREFIETFLIPFAPRPSRLALTFSLVLLAVAASIFYLRSTASPPLGKVLAKAGMERLPGDVKANELAEAVSALLAPEGIEPARALLPDTSVPEAAYFLSLGILVQNAEILFAFQDLGDEAREQAALMTEQMETLLESMKGQGSLTRQVALFRERLMSNLYGPEELREFLGGIRAGLRQLAHSPGMRAQRAPEIFDFGLWLALLNRDLSLQVRGRDRTKELSGLLRPEYVVALEEVGPLCFDRVSLNQLHPAFSGLEDAAEELRTGNFSRDAALASLQAVKAMANLSFQWGLSG